MANLDKLLKKLEQNKENAEKTTTHQLTIGGEIFDVRTMTRKEKQDYFYSLKIGETQITFGEYVKRTKKYIYSCMNLKELAAKAKEDGLIESFYDVIDYLFEPDELLEIIGFIEEINGTNQVDIKEEVEKVKK